MGSIIQARDLRGKRRVNLADAVPLDTPFTMFIEPTNACNYRCKFCPTGHPELLRQHGRAVTMMSLDTFQRIVDQIAEFPSPLKMLNLYKDGESLLHPDFVKMVRYARYMDISEKIWVKTNGQNLSPEYNKQLVECGLDMIGISVNGVDDESFQAVTGKHVNYQKYRANVLDLYRRRGDVKVSVKIADTGLTDHQKQKFIDDFSDRADFIAIEGLHGWSTSNLYDWKLGTDKSFDGTPRVDKIVCPLVLYMLTVSANGDVSICNDDAFHLHQLGNIHNETVTELWHGDRLRQFRLMHLEGRRADNAACGPCDYMKALPDNVDGDRKVIHEKLSSL